jgi:hypothetical protein
MRKIALLGATTAILTIGAATAYAMSPTLPSETSSRAILERQTLAPPASYEGRSTHPDDAGWLRLRSEDYYHPEDNIYHEPSYSAQGDEARYYGRL